MSNTVPSKQALEAAGALIRSRRMSKRLSLRQLSELTDPRVHYSTIQRIEQGDNPQLSISTLLAVGQPLDLDVVTLTAPFIGAGHNVAEVTAS